MQIAPDAFARALEHVRTMAERCAEHVVPTAVGRAFLHDRYRFSYAHNFLAVEVADAAPHAVLAAAEAALGGAGRTHRQVFAAGAALVDRLAPALANAGYRVERQRVLVLPPRAGVGAASPAAVVPFDAVRGLRLASWPEIDDPAVVRQLVDRAVVTAAACRLRHVAAPAGDAPQSAAELRTDVVPGVAQIEEIWTDTDARGRGLATAVIGHAVAVARAEGADVVFLIAADDGPLALYRRLGFVEVGVLLEAGLREREA